MKEYSVKVIQGPHRGDYFNSDRSCVTLEIEGRQYRYEWANDIKMKPYLLDCLLDECVSSEDALREVARDHFMEYITDIDCDITIGELRMEIGSFCDGWKACNKVKAAELVSIA